MGNFDQAIGVSEVFAGAIIALADWIGELARGDFSAWAATDALKLMGQAVIVLAATQIPALIGGMVAAMATARTLGATFLWQYYVTGRLAGAMSLLRSVFAMIGGPLGIIAAGVAALGMSFYGAMTHGDKLSETLGAIADGQADVNAAIEKYQRIQSVDNPISAQNAIAGELGGSDRLILDEAGGWLGGRSGDQGGK